MRVERTAKLSSGCETKGAASSTQVDKNSVVVGGHLLNHDEKVKVSAKKNACSNADQNSCENILRRTAMCEVLLQYVAFQQHTSSLNL